jgi:hypothetical protein
VTTCKIFVIVAASTQSFDYGLSTRIFCFLKIGMLTVDLNDTFLTLTLDLSRTTTIDYILFYIPMTVIFMGILVLYDSSSSCPSFSYVATGSYQLSINLPRLSGKQIQEIQLVLLCRHKSVYWLLQQWYLFYIYYPSLLLFLIKLSYSYL